MRRFVTSLPRLAALAASLCAALAACDAPGGASGQIAGQSLEVRDALYANAPSGRGVVLALFDRDAACEAFEAGSLIADSATLAIYAEQRVGAHTLGGAVGARDFEASFTKLDERCGPIRLTTADGPRAAAKAKAGQLTIDTLELTPDARAKGRFDLSFGGAERFRGEFNARYCPALTRDLGNKPFCQHQ